MPKRKLATPHADGKVLGFSHSADPGETRLDAVNVFVGNNC